MKITRFSALFALTLAAAACGGAAEDQPPIDDTAPAPAPAPTPMTPDTTMMQHPDTTTTTTTGL